MYNHLECLGRLLQEEKWKNLFKTKNSNSKIEKQSHVLAFLVTLLILFAPMHFPKVSRLKEFWLWLAPFPAHVWIAIQRAACSTGGQCTPVQAQPLASLPFICHWAAWLCPLATLVFQPRNGRIALMNNARFVNSNIQSSRSFCSGNLFIVLVSSNMQGWNPYRFHITVSNWSFVLQE